MNRAILLLLLAGAARAQEPNFFPKPDAFETLINPNCSHCIDESKRRKAELRDDDPVLVWTRGKYDGGAIPMRFFLAPYRVISDTYGAFVYDPDAGYARAFPASLDYRFHGWRNGIMVMKHKDGTLFSCLSGRAFDGPRKGEKLPFWPTVVADWGWYVKHYPGGVVYHMYEKYKPVDLPMKPNEDSVKTRLKRDKALPADEMVVGFLPPKLDLIQAAVPLATLENTGRYGVMNIPLGKDLKPLVIFWYGPTRTAAVYEQRAEKHEAAKDLGVEGAVLKTRDDVEIVADGKSAAAPFLDKKTKSRFDITGRCVAGDLKGWTLVPVECVTCKWFAWSAEYPETGLVK